MEDCRISAVLIALMGALSDLGIVHIPWTSDYTFDLSSYAKSCLLTLRFLPL